MDACVCVCGGAGVPKHSGVRSVGVLFYFVFFLTLFFCFEGVAVSGCLDSLVFPPNFFFTIVFKVWVSLDASRVGNVRVVDGLWLRLKVHFF